MQKLKALGERAKNSELSALVIAPRGHMRRFWSAMRPPAFGSRRKPHRVEYILTFSAFPLIAQWNSQQFHSRAAWKYARMKNPCGLRAAICVLRPAAYFATGRSRDRSRDRRGRSTSRSTSCIVFHACERSIAFMFIIPRGRRVKLLGIPLRF